MLQIDFGNNVKEARKNMDFSQEQLSLITGIERGQISKIESGQINVTLETIERLSNALKVTPKNLIPDVLFSFKEKMHPFVKWAGGKTQILTKIKSLLPKEWNRYFEPFVGGGALLFSLAPDDFVINDMNEDLISVFRCLCDDKLFIQFMEELKTHEKKHSEKYYLKIRGMDREPTFSSLPLYKRAARMVYLNKACFNGLYRVNSSGFFNVPSGKKKNVKTFDEDNINTIHRYFQNSKLVILNEDYSKAVAEAKAHDFVYFDPPFDTFEEKDNGFTSYTENGFGRDEQRRLASVYKDLTDRGVLCTLSNHNTSLINDLYKDYHIHVVPAKRMINSKGSGRGNVEEVLITNY
jgi:DNA adenine methylase